MKLSKLIKITLGLSLCHTCFIKTEAHEGCCDKDEKFEWTKEKTESAQIAVQTAKAGVIQNFIQVPGKIMIHPDYMAYVIPTVHGVVKEVRKNVGDTVEKGEVLAIIESKEIAEAKATYLAALKKLSLQQTLLKSEEQLRGISQGQDYLNAKHAAEEAFINAELARQNLYTLGFTDQELVKMNLDGTLTSRFYEVKAPLNGRVLQRSLTLGELVNNKAKVYTIANFEKVLAEIHISQHDLPLVKEALPIEITSYSGKTEVAKISQFNPTLCEETRTATALALIDNHLEQWTPGEFISVKIQTNLTAVSIALPRNAVQNIKGESYIFVENGDTFIPRLVRLGKMDEENVEILAGIEEGETCATCNTFLLKAEYEKGEEGGHSH